MESQIINFVMRGNVKMDESYYNISICTISVCR